MTTRQEGDVVFRCPVCGAHVDGVTPGQVPPARPRGGSLEEQIEAHTAAVVAANEALLLFHAESTHTIKQVMLALGMARTALMDIVAITDRPESDWQETLDLVLNTVDRGLGGF